MQTPMPMPDSDPPPLEVVPPAAPELDAPEKIVPMPDCASDANPTAAASPAMLGEPDRGNLDAQFDRWIVELYSSMRVFVERRLARSPDDADDIMQEAALRLFTYFSSLPLAFDRDRRLEWLPG